MIDYKSIKGSIKTPYGANNERKATYLKSLTPLALLLVGLLTVGTVAACQPAWSMQNVGGAK